MHVVYTTFIAVPIFLCVSETLTRRLDDTTIQFRNDYNNYTGMFNASESIYSIW